MIEWGSGMNVSLLFTFYLKDHRLFIKAHHLFKKDGELLFLVISSVKLH